MAVGRLRVNAVDGVVCVGERLFQESLDVGVRCRVVGEGPFPPNLDEPGEAQFGQMLAHARGAGVDQFCQTVDRRLPLEKGHKDLDAVFVAQHAEGVSGHLDIGVVGHLEIRNLLMHEAIITCLTA